MAPSLQLMAQNENVNVSATLPSLVNGTLRMILVLHAAYERGGRDNCGHRSHIRVHDPYIATHDGRIGRQHACNGASLDSTEVLCLRRVGCCADCLVYVESQSVCLPGTPKCASVRSCAANWKSLSVLFGACFAVIGLTDWTCGHYNGVLWVQCGTQRCQRGHSRLDAIWGLDSTLHLSGVLASQYGWTYYYWDEPIITIASIPKDYAEDSPVVSFLLYFVQSPQTDFLQKNSSGALTSGRLMILDVFHTRATA